MTSTERARVIGHALSGLAVWRRTEVLLCLPPPALALLWAALFPRDAEVIALPTRHDEAA